MQKLKCTENGCVHNYCKHCVKDVVQISRDACCDSFDLKGPKNENNAKSEFEFACECGLGTKEDNHHILCNEENCNYWNFGECSLHQVKIQGRMNEAKCATYTPKK